MCNVCYSVFSENSLVICCIQIHLEISTVYANVFTVFSFKNLHAVLLHIHFLLVYGFVVYPEFTKMFPPTC